jgi:hypothetical protein
MLTELAMSPARAVRIHAAGSRPRSATRPNWSTLGSRDAASWLSDRNLPLPTTRWFAEIALDTRDRPAPAEFDERVDTRFHLDLYSEEWGFLFCHGGKVSRIRVTDIPFVHGRDEFQLLAVTPTLGVIGSFLRQLEHDHDIRFRREHALVHTDLPSAELQIRRWVLSM